MAGRRRQQRRSASVNGDDGAGEAETRSDMERGLREPLLGAKAEGDPAGRLYDGDKPSKQDDKESSAPASFRELFSFADLVSRTTLGQRWLRLHRSARDVLRGYGMLKLADSRHTERV